MALPQSVGYKNNQNLPKHGYIHAFTHNERNEFIKCAHDPIYFAKKYIKIVNVDKGLIPFDMWDFQENMINTFHKNRFSICKLPRQVGKCLHADTKIMIRNTITKDSIKISLGDLYRLTKGDKPNQNLGFCSKKFIDTKPTKNIEILTDTGWHPISFIHKTIEYTEWILKTENCEIIGADDHIVFGAHYNEVFIKDLRVGDYIRTNRGLERVVFVEETSKKDNMYDVSVDSEDHRFYSNGILSHNTTTAVAYLLHYILFNRNVKVAILANKGPTAREILSRLQLAYEYLPRFLQQGIKTWNKGFIELSNGSIAVADSTSGSSVRGKSFNIIFLDEFAFVPNNIAEAFFMSTYPTISSGDTTKVIIVSTPNGLNLFYKMWMDAVEKKSLYVPIEIHWSMVPGRDEAWKELTIRNTSEDQFRQEFECVSGKTLIQIRDKLTGKEETISINELYQRV